MTFRISARLFRIPLALALALGLGLRAAPAMATPLDFEGLGSGCDADNPSGSFVPDGYGNLNWSTIGGGGSSIVGLICDANYQAGTGFDNSSGGANSPDWAAYNGGGNATMEITPIWGTLNFNSGFFSTFALSNDFAGFSAPSIAFNGYKPGDPDGAPSFTWLLDLTTGWTAFPDGPWVGLNRLEILAGTDYTFGSPQYGQSADGLNFRMDDLDIDVVPEPASVLLLGAGLVTVARRLRRRAA